MYTQVESLSLMNLYYSSTPSPLHFWRYCIAGKFGGEKVWRIDSFQAFGERKFGELIDQPIHN